MRKMKLGFIDVLFFILPNVLPAAALRVLADIIFAYCFHFISRDQLSLPTNPVLRLPAR